jgi:hypothetical protein
VLSGLIGARQLHTPTSWLELFVLAGVLAGTFAVMRRVASAPYAALICAIGLLCYTLDAQLFIPTAILLAGLLTLTRRPPMAAERSAGALLGEIGIVGSGFLLYELGRVVSEGSLDHALRNAGRLVAVQRALPIPRESALQAVVLHSDLVVEAFNLVYSFLFLSYIAGVLIWLYLNDEAHYRLLRNMLGLSALLTVIVSAVFPVAPPRLYPASGLVDTHVLMGRTHGFVNEYAAVPSLHVGWTVLAGYIIARSSGTWRGRLAGLLPAALISITVVVTGNHYWLDGVAGIVICLGPALVAVHRQRATPRTIPRPAFVGRAGVTLVRAGRATAETLVQVDRARSSAIALGGMLCFLLIGQLVAPGFTDHWWYLTPQVAITLALAVSGEVVFRRRGGLFSWQTHLAVVAATMADLLGTAGDMYANHASYDKIMHFIGTAAVTAVAVDILCALEQHGRLRWQPTTIVAAAIAVGVVLGGAWEVYEYVGDNVFNSTRTGGFWDTTYDLIFDTLGALLIGAAFTWWRWPQRVLQERAAYARLQQALGDD